MNRFLSAALIAAFSLGMTAMTSCDTGKNGPDDEVDVTTPLAFTANEGCDLPKMTVGTAITEINVAPAANGGTHPYTFSASGLPAGIAISAGGIIAGTPTAAKAAGTATVTVKDSSSPQQSKSITINCGAVTEAQIVLPDQSELTQTSYADEKAGGGFTFTAKSAWTASVAETTGSKASAAPQTYSPDQDAANEVPAVSRAGAATRASGVSWLRLLLDGEETYSGGAGAFTLTIELDENYTGADRSAAITISSGDTGITVSVTQKGTSEGGTTLVAVQSINISPMDEFSVEPGGSLQFTAAVLPENATEKGMIWSVPESVATVDETGKMTVNADAAISTAFKVMVSSKADPSIWTQSGYITVAPPRVPVTGIKIYVQGDSNIVEMPSFKRTYNYASLDSDSESGGLTLPGAPLTGTLYIYPAPAESGGSYIKSRLYAIVYPENATNTNVTITSSNTTVVQLEDVAFGSYGMYLGDGYVSSVRAWGMRPKGVGDLAVAMGEGTSVITATTEEGGFTATCEITVEFLHPTGVQIVEEVYAAAFSPYPKYTPHVPLGATFWMGGNVLPDGTWANDGNYDNNAACFRGVTWSNSKPEVVTATPANHGLNPTQKLEVTAKAPGTATITVRSDDGGHTDWRTVTVFTEDTDDLPIPGEDVYHTWAEAKAACATKAGGWRLPTREELQGMKIHRSGKGYAEDVYSIYWSSTEMENNCVYALSFYAGGHSVWGIHDGPISKTPPHYYYENGLPFDYHGRVRCVR